MDVPRATERQRQRARVVGNNIFAVWCNICEKCTHVIFRGIDT